MRATIPYSLLLFACLASPAAEASRRAIRVDGFGTWDLYALPSADCPGTAAASTLVDWRGYTFSGRDAVEFLTDTYCQVPMPDTLNQDTFFYSDESGLRTLIGANTNNAVTAIRYALLDRDRFDFDQPATGFQWTFYRFAAGDAETTIVGLYGLEALTFDALSYIEYGGVRLWDGSIDGYDGQYFCFDGDRYLGTWLGDINDGSDCVQAAQRVFRGSFEP